MVRALLLMLVCGAAWPAWAQDASPSAALFAALNDDDPAAREDALDAVLLDRTQTAGELEALADRAAEAGVPESAWRLRFAALHHERRLVVEAFPAQGAGALGIAHRPGVAAAGADGARPAVEVVDIVPGFPAAGRLRAGDLIVSFQDVDLRALAAVPGVPGVPAEAFSALIRQHPPGAEVAMEIIRDGRSMRITLPLSNGAALQQLGQP